MIWFILLAVTADHLTTRKAGDAHANHSESRTNAEQGTGADARQPLLEVELFIGAAQLDRYAQ